MTMSQLPSPAQLRAAPLVKSVVLPSLRASQELRQHLLPSLSLAQAPMPMAMPMAHATLAQLPIRQDERVLGGALRRGKWTRAEEDYAAALISFFCDGLLAIQYGTTLRGFLAQQLHCDPMRISKKLLPGSVFAGIKINPKIGRRAYYPCSQDSPAALAARDHAKRQLSVLRAAFIRSVEEEEALEAGNCSSSVDVKAKLDASPSSVAALPAVLGRKRSYNDVVSAALRTAELSAPQITYHERQSPSKLARFTHQPVDSHALELLMAGRRRSFTALPSPPMTSVLPPLRVSLVRASMTS